MSQNAAMSPRTIRRLKHAQMSWEIARPRWFRGGPGRGKSSPAYVWYIGPGGQAENLSHVMWNRAEKRRQREHARAQRARAAAMGDVWFAPVSPGWKPTDIAFCRS